MFRVTNCWDSQQQTIHQTRKAADTAAIAANMQQLDRQCYTPVSIVESDGDSRLGFYEVGRFEACMKT